MRCEPSNYVPVKTFPKSHLYRWLKQVAPTGHRDRSVLKALVRLSNSEGSCRVAWDALCDETGMSRMTLHRALCSLRKQGLVTSKLNYNKRGKRTRSTYQLNCAQQAAIEPPTKYQSDTASTVDLSDSESLPGGCLDSRSKEDTSPPYLTPARSRFWAHAPRLPNPFPNDPPPPWDDLPPGRWLS